MTDPQRTRLTKRLVESLKPGPAEFTVWDTDIKGFGVRVLPSGRKSYIFRYRPYPGGRGAPIRKPTIGEHGRGVTTDEARKIADKWRAAVTAGGDPSKEKDEARKAPTVADLANRYIEDYAKRAKRTWKEDKAKLTSDYLAHLRRKRVADVTSTDIEDVKRRLADKPVTANRYLALLSKVFSLAMRWEMRSDNPVKGIERNHEDRRERYLSPAELARLAEQLAKHPERNSANALCLLLLTGARAGEVYRATWEQFDLEAGVWTKPSSHTKTKKIHRVPLSPAALVVLQEQQELSAGSPYVFPGRKQGEPMRKTQGTWDAVCKAAGIEDARIHDLRHTYASLLVGSGLSLPIIGQLLGHTQPATTQRYAHLADDPLREATGRVGALFDALNKGTSGEVVPMKRPAP